MFIGAQFLALYFSPCTLSLCLPLLIHTLSRTIHMMMTQLQAYSPPDKVSKLLPFMQSCVNDIKAWAAVNMLKFNENKTTFMFATSKRTKPFHSLSTSINACHAQIPFKIFFMTLGFTLDCHLTVNEHVINIAKTCHFELHRLASICGFLINTATAALVFVFNL